MTSQLQKRSLLLKRRMKLGDEDEDEDDKEKDEDDEVKRADSKSQAYVAYSKSSEASPESTPTIDVAA